MLSSDSKYPSVLIVGLGNELLGDDGVGVHAVRKMLEDPPEGVRVVEVGTKALHNQKLLEDADVVIAIDAVRAGGRPGSIYRFKAEEALAERCHSLHDMGISGVLRIMPGDRRPHVIILGVEPETIAYSMDLSLSVRSALSRLISAARRITEEIEVAGLASLDAAPPNVAPHRQKGIEDEAFLAE